jgi:hypothetical protein
VLALALSFAGSAFAQIARPAPRLRILDHVPARNALGVARTTSVSVTFDQPLDAASVDPRSFQVFGRWSGPHSGAFTLSPNGRVLRFTPAAPFSPGETVTVTLARGVISVFGRQLPRGYAWSFWTESRASSGGYTHTGTLFPGTTPYGVHGGDIDGDGDLDLCVPNEDSSDVSVFLNQGSGTFGAETKSCFSSSSETMSSISTSARPWVWIASANRWT